MKRCIRVVLLHAWAASLLGLTAAAAEDAAPPPAQREIEGRNGRSSDGNADLPSDDDFQLELEEQDGFADPLEPVNRAMLALNEQIDYFLLDPVTRAYSWVVPDPARQSIRNVFDNLNSPSVFVNDVIQLEFTDAGVILTRFVVNSTVGIVGLFDPAERFFGFSPHASDFGQTLALAKVGSGPYLVLPLLGPTTLRDACGSVVDLFMRPTFYILGPGQQLFYGGSSGFVTLEENYEAVKALEESSIDLYAALRNAYYQSRVAQIWSRREHRKKMPPFDGGES